MLREPNEIFWTVTLAKLLKFALRTRLKTLGEAGSESVDIIEAVGKFATLITGFTDSRMASLSTVVQ